MPTSPSDRAAIGSEDTIAAPSAATSGTVTRTLVSTQGRTTCLPRRVQPGAAEARVDQRFHHVKPLGEGGMGEVLLALDEDIQRKVAIKRLRADRANDAMLLRFADEVRIVGQLEHPSIVPVHDVGVDDHGQVYLVMKYVEGETLENVIDKLRAGDPAYAARFPISERVEIVAKILEALSYAHDRSLLHRDLKPANVMIGPHGEVTLMDWGIAKHIGATDVGVDELASTSGKHDRLVETQMGALLGTPMYMSPEQAAGKNAELDARSDVFAVGIVAVELFTLVHPMHDLDALPAVLASLLHKDFGAAAIGGLFTRANAPAELMWLCVGALARDPQKRYANAGAMLAEVRAVQAGRVTTHCPITFTKMVTGAFTRWVDRHPTLWLIVMSTTALAIVAAIVGGAVLGVRALAR